MIKKIFRKTQETLRAFHGHITGAKRKMERETAESAVQVKEEKREKNEIVISAGTMAKFVVITLLLLLLMAFLYEIRDILIIFFVSLLFAAALDPMVDALERRKIPRSLGVIIIYIAVLLFLGIFVSNLVPVVANEVSELASKVQDFISNILKGETPLPQFLERFRPALKHYLEGVDLSQVGNYKDVLLNIANKLSDVAGNVFNAVIVIFNGFFNTVLVLVITFLMTVDEKGIDKFILSLFPERHALYIKQKSDAIKEKMGYWLRGQIVLCVVVGLCVYIGFLIIGIFTKDIHYAATIALVAGFTELIPYVGPFLAWLIALPIVANQSLMLIVWMTVLMYVVQTLENNIIVPLVMHRAVGISPIFVMFSMMVGFSFLGVLGMVIAVPVATAISIFVKDYADKGK